MGKDRARLGNEESEGGVGWGPHLTGGKTEAQVPLQAGAQASAGHLFLRADGGAQRYWGQREAGRRKLNRDPKGNRPKRTDISRDWPGSRV